MSNRPERTRRRGTLLVEMLFAILLVSVTLLIAARLLQGISRVYRDAPATADALRAQSRWLQRMRDDAWAARGVDATADGLNVDLGDDRSVAWRITSGQLTRIEGAETQRWPDGRAFRWDVRRLAIVLSVGDAEVSLATPSLADGSRR